MFRRFFEQFSCGSSVQCSMSVSSMFSVGGVESTELGCQTNVDLGAKNVDTETIRPKPNIIPIKWSRGDRGQLTGTCGCQKSTTILHKSHIKLEMWIVAQQQPRRDGNPEPSTLTFTKTKWVCVGYAGNWNCAFTSMCTRLFQPRAVLTHGHMIISWEKDKIQSYDLPVQYDTVLCPENEMCKVQNSNTCIE